VDAVVGNIREIFLSTLRQTEGTIRGEWSGSSVRFGYVAQSDYIYLLVCWNNSGISFQRGVNIPAGTVTAAFSEKTPR